MAETKSKLIEWLESRPRWFRDVVVADVGFRNHDGSPLANVRFWINTKADENDALLCAYRDAEQAARKFTETAVAEARRDPDFIQDMKTVHALWRACRNPENDLPAFPTPEWMQAHLNANQLGYLLNLYNACTLEEAGLTPTYERERVEAYRDGVIAAWGSELPERSLAPLPREHLTSLCLMAMRHWHDEREALLARIEELEHASQGVEPGGAAGESSRAGAEPVGGSS
jgi:hypothetical protein